jgi:hypothetical protein
MANDAAALCVACTALIFVVLMILYIVYSAIILDETSEAAGECYQVWIYCLVVLILNGINFSIGGVKEKDENGKPKDGLANRLFNAITLAIFIWSCVIYSKVDNDEECKDIYTNEYPRLWVLFNVIFWTNIAVCILFGVFLLIIICSM